MTPLLDKASLRSRLRDTRGFMIAEQLASIVFIGLLCVAVGVGLQVAMNSTPPSPGRRRPTRCCNRRWR